MSDLRVGDQLMVVAKVKNIDTRNGFLYFGGIGNDRDGNITFATVSEIKTGTSCGKHIVTCTRVGDRVYCTTLVSGKYAIYENMPEVCDFLDTSNSLVFKDPFATDQNDGMWWMVNGPGSAQCSEVCCEMGPRCNCDGWYFGCPDTGISATEVEGGCIEWVSLRIELPRGWKEAHPGLGHGRIVIKIGLPIQGDIWTGREYPIIDMVGHVAAMSVIKFEM